MPGDFSREQEERVAQGENRGGNCDGGGCNGGVDCFDPRVCGGIAFLTVTSPIWGGTAYTGWGLTDLIKNNPLFDPQIKAKALAYTMRGLAVALPILSAFAAWNLSRTSAESFAGNNCRMEDGSTCTAEDTWLDGLIQFTAGTTAAAVTTFVERIPNQHTWQFWKRSEWTKTQPPQAESSLREVTSEVEEGRGRSLQISSPI